MADVSSRLYNWSTNEASNAPTGNTTIGTGLDDNLRQIQATVRAELSKKGSDIASAATTDLGATAGSSHDITGSTTITSFGTVDSGIWKVCRHTATCVVKYSSALLTPSAADITAMPGDCHYDVSLGSGNWVMPFYQRVDGRAINWNPYIQATAVASASTINLDAIAPADFAHISGTTTCSAITLAAGVQRVTVTDGAMTFTNSANLIMLGGASITSAAGDVQVWRGEGSSVVRNVAYHKKSGLPVVRTTASTRTVIAGSSGTYSTPATATSLNVRLIGGGGGGSGDNSGAGTTGGSTTFGGILTGSGGAGGSPTAGGAGGAASGGNLNLVGGIGSGAASPFTAGNFASGGAGGNGPFGGGGGGGGGASTGRAGSSSTGGGGGGGGSPTGGPGVTAGGGGGSGGYVEYKINTVSASYAYSVGAGGAGASGSTSAGGAGGSGVIIIDEFYD